ncbi:hypothetical protein ACLOJK_011572 [Asimina triloba]
MARLKQAKEEAEKEIAEYRAHIEAEFQKKVAEVNANNPFIGERPYGVQLYLSLLDFCSSSRPWITFIVLNSGSPFFCSISRLDSLPSSGDSGSNVKRLEQETEAKIEHLKSQAARISPEVVDMLLKHATTVKN